jgi:hypothetical protein
VARAKRRNCRLRLSRPEAGQLEPVNPHRPGGEIEDEYTSRPEAVAGGVRHDVGDSGHEDLAVIDESVRPMANESITRRNRPVSVSDDAGIVEVDERCSDERDRHDVAGTRIHVGEHVKVLGTPSADPRPLERRTLEPTELAGLGEASSSQCLLSPRVGGTVTDHWHREARTDNVR